MDNDQWKAHVTAQSNYSLSDIYTRFRSGGQQITLKGETLNMLCACRASTYRDRQRLPRQKYHRIALLITDKWLWYGTARH
jgi:hypothetical protein